MQAEAVAAPGAEREMIDELRGRIDAWRQSDSKSRAMPDDLWEDASAAAQMLGVHRVSRELGLNYQALQRRAATGATLPAQSPPEFIELGGLPAAMNDAGGGDEAVVDVVGADGTKLTVRLKGPSVSTNLAALVKAVWKRS
ncbi:MAG TPA: hypothetical protein VK820_06195 [Steroidobacteraceae bacterium]|jgi:hypothetical protein|nr:hypothetical protein [Steroidobacteraceae bacterium]